MSSKNNDYKKESMKYSKVVANIPEGLLKEFDSVCEGRYYSRAEGIKEAMREFIANSSSENSTTMNKIPIKQGFEGIIDLVAGLATDPRIQKLQEEKRSKRKSS